MPGEKRVKVVSSSDTKRKWKSDKPAGSKSFNKSGNTSFEGPKARNTKSGKSFGEEKFQDKKYSKKPGSFQRPDKKSAESPRKKSLREPVGKKYFREEKNKAASRQETPANFKGRRKNYGKAADDLLKGRELVEGEVRINRYIANSGLCSRREADVMIQQGLVSVNGVVVTELGGKIKPGDDVRVDGKRINPEKPVYILLNKPKGYITSTTDPTDRATVMDLIDLPGKERIYPVGRLDRNTTGVLLLTNDGELAQKLMHPSFEIKKIYKARLDQKPAKEHMLAWVNGVELEDGFMSFEQIGFVDEEDPTVLGLEVHSGRNRIVRRMFEHFGYEVESLDRVMLGEFDHLKLGRGKWRFLNEKEIRYVEQLKRMKGKKPRR